MRGKWDSASRPIRQATLSHAALNCHLPWRLLDVALVQSSDHFKRRARKASEFATRAAEQIVDKSISSEEQQRRKRALIQGPKEFREIREGLPKRKRS
jgi:hypothetical protein